MINDFSRTILENLYEGVYLVDNDRKILYWNKALRIFPVTQALKYWGNDVPIISVILTNMVFNYA